MKETFIVRTEWMDSVLEMEPANRAIVFENLFYFHADKENLINLNNQEVKLVWKLIEPNLKRNIGAYKASVENGKLGGRPPKKNKPKKPNVTSPNLIVSVIDSVSEGKEKYKKKNLTEQLTDEMLTPFDHDARDDIKTFCERIDEKYHRIQGMKEPLTAEEVCRLQTDYGLSNVQDTVRAMENWGKLNSNVSANLTLRNWYTKNSNGQTAR